MTLPNSRNTNYQAAGGEVKSKDLDDLQDYTVRLFDAAPSVKHSGISTTGMELWGVGFAHAQRAFCFVPLDLAGGIRFTRGGALRGDGVAGPGPSIGATVSKIISHPTQDIILVARDSASTTTVNRLCVSTNGGALTSVTLPVSSTAMPKISWAGSKFWATFDATGNNAWNSPDGVTWATAAQPNPGFGSLNYLSAVGPVVVGSSIVQRFIVAATNGLGGMNVYRSDDNGVTWSSLVAVSPFGFDSLTYLPGVGFVLVGSSSSSHVDAAVRVSVDGITWTNPNPTFVGVPSVIAKTGLKYVCVVKGRLFGVVTHSNTPGNYTASIGGFIVTSKDAVTWTVVDYITVSGTVNFAEERSLVGGSDYLLVHQGSTVSLIG